MSRTITKLVSRLDKLPNDLEHIIKWGSPIPSFGNIETSLIATLGLNPSNKEFMDNNGNELTGAERRFHSLSSLSLEKWSDITSQQLELILESCHEYFYRNPYDNWFKVLDYLISGTKNSFYDRFFPACHLDLVPYATSCKWAELSQKQKLALLGFSSDSLGLLLKDSKIELLILNGRTVVESLQLVANKVFHETYMEEWTLPRYSCESIKGFAYTGYIENISGIDIGRKIKILGFNHNIQSSFGVTNKVKASIQNWITDSME